MKRLLLLLLAAMPVAAVIWIYARRSAPPEVPLVEVRRENLASTLVTNGKVDPVEWSPVHSVTAGVVRRIAVARGGEAVKGGVLAELDAGEARAQLAAAEARLEQARAELRTIERGGRAAELAGIDSEILRARGDLEIARREAESLERLAARDAAPRQEAAQARDRVETVRTAIAALEKRRAALVSADDRAAAEARLKEAEAAAARARELIAASVIRAPLSGTVFELPARAGEYLPAGALLAQIGRLERVRVTIYVDEPELGRASAGMPVTITWDALPGKEWTGQVERVLPRIVALGTRQVGEVIATIDNPDRELVPGANVNATIQSRTAGNALTIPREALRREDGAAGVYRLNGKVLEWRPVETGIASVTRVEIRNGLAAGDQVVGATDVRLAPGMEVRPARR